MVMILEDLLYLRVDYIQDIQRNQIWEWQPFVLEFQSILDILEAIKRKIRNRKNINCEINLAQIPRILFRKYTRLQKILEIRISFQLKS